MSTQTVDAGRRHTSGADHVAAVAEAVARFDGADQLAVTARWGRQLAEWLPQGRRLIAVGNGGSAAQAQHLTAEIVGRYCRDRQPFSAVSLHVEPCVLTAIVNDYGVQEMYARQVGAHGRAGDVLVLMSTSGGSANVAAAARRARELGLVTWAMTGAGPNPLASLCDDALVVDADETAVVQTVHLMALHLVCAALDDELAAAGRLGSP
jgi:phosphoheptose isomerase